MKTKAAILRAMHLDRPYDRSNPLEIGKIELDPPGPGEVLVKVAAAGLCHSDLSVIDGSRPRPMPMVLGHEAAGEVVEPGQGVSKVQPGDHVVFTFLPMCGSCLDCQTGRPALCATGNRANAAGNLVHNVRRIRQGKNYFFHHLGVSGFAQYAVASELSIVKINPEIPFPIAALFGCAVLTGVGAVIHTGNLRMGESVMVVGLGGVGLSAILGAVAGGASRIIGVDINIEKRKIAKSLGADHVIDPTESTAIEQIRDLTEGGPALAVEFAGAIPALEFAFEATRRGGRTVTGALPHPDARMTLSPTTLVGQEKQLRGSYLGSCVPSRDIPAFLSLYQSGRLPVNKLITHQFGLEDINTGFERLAKGEAIRQIVIP